MYHPMMLKAQKALWETIQCSPWTWQSTVGPTHLQWTPQPVEHSFWVLQVLSLPSAAAYTPHRALFPGSIPLEQTVVVASGHFWVLELYVSQKHRHLIFLGIDLFFHP